jgi:hypothetical protein
MASRTFDDIVNEGMLLAGRDDLAVRIGGLFNDWLQRMARSWPWPDLTVINTASVPAGTFAFPLVPDNEAGSVYSRILDNNWLYRTDRSARQRLRIIQVTSDIPGFTAPAIGIPTTVILYKDPDAVSGWSFIFNNTTDRAYSLLFSAVKVPARVSTVEIPWYPEDDTCIQQVMTQTLLYSNGPEDGSYQAALEVLSQMVQRDRVVHGVTPSQNIVMQLNPGRFR